MALNLQDEGHLEEAEIMLQDLGLKRREDLSTQDDRTRLASDYQKRLFNATNRVNQSEIDPEMDELKNAWKSLAEGATDDEAGLDNLDDGQSHRYNRFLAERESRFGAGCGARGGRAAARGGFSGGFVAGRGSGRGGFQFHQDLPARVQFTANTGNASGDARVVMPQQHKPSRGKAPLRGGLSMPLTLGNHAVTYPGPQQHTPSRSKAPLRGGLSLPLTLGNHAVTYPDRGVSRSLPLTAGSSFSNDAHASLPSQHNMGLRAHKHEQTSQQPTPTRGERHPQQLQQSNAKGRRLHISNLPNATSERELKAFFKHYLVESTFIPVNPQSNRPIGHAFVDLSTPAEAERALRELNNQTILDRQVSNQLARGPQPRSAAAVALRNGGSVEAQGQAHQQKATPIPSKRSETTSLTSGSALQRPPVAQAAQQIQQRIIAGTRRAARHVAAAELADPSSFLLACDNLRKTATESTSSNAAAKGIATAVPTPPAAAVSVQEASTSTSLQSARDNVLKTAIEVTGNNAAGRLDATAVPRELPAPSDLSHAAAVVAGNQAPPTAATSVQEASITTSLQSRRPSWASVTSTATSRSRPVKAVSELANPDDWLRKRDQVLGRGSAANTKPDVSQNQDRIASDTAVSIAGTQTALSVDSNATTVVAQTPASLFAADRAAKSGSALQPVAPTTAPTPPVLLVTASSKSVPKEIPEATRADSVLGNHEPLISLFDEVAEAPKQPTVQKDLLGLTFAMRSVGLQGSKWAS